MQKAIQIPFNNAFALKCQCAAEAGFQYISVNYAQVLGKTEDEWEKITEEIQGLLDQNRLSCLQSHPHFYSPFKSSELIEEELEFAIKQAVLSSAKLGAKYCVIHPRSSISTGYRFSKSLEDNKKWFDQLLSHASKCGTKIAAENLPIFPSSNRIRPLFSSDPDDLMALADAFGEDQLGVCWDVGHANMIDAEQAPMIEALGERIKCTHIHNNFGQMDEHAPPVYGNIPWDRVMTALKSIGYDGPLTLETHCWYEEEKLLHSFYKHNYDSLVYLTSL